MQPGVYHDFVRVIHIRRRRYAVLVNLVSTCDDQRAKKIPIGLYFDVALVRWVHTEGVGTESVGILALSNLVPIERAP